MKLSMKMFAGLIVLLIVAFTSATQALTTVAQDKNPYPNELPTLRLHRDAKWNSLRPYVSTEDEIHKVLGKPVPFYDETSRSYVAGYEVDFGWTIVVAIVGKGGNLPDSVVDRLEEITLYPKQRVSLIGADFYGFSKNKILYNSDTKLTVYSDKFGLQYVVYAEDAADGRFHVGDLKLIKYGASDAATKRLTGIPDSDTEQSLAADGAIACFSSSLFPSTCMLIARRS
jgi:hypothetical protein